VFVWTPDLRLNGNAIGDVADGEATVEIEVAALPARR